jgi:hypothetical protein
MLDLILNDHRHFHSDWQCDYAITVKAGGTLYGCYRQAVRELHKRWRGLRESYKLRALAQIDLEEAEEKTDRRAMINAADLRLSLLEAVGVIRDTEREFLRFYGQAVALRRSLGLEDSEPMPDDMRERLDVEMWAHHLRTMAAVDFMTCSRLQKGTVELLQACPPDMRRDIAADICNPSRHNELVEWYMTYAPPIPAPLAIPAEEARHLLESVCSRGLNQSASCLPAVLSSNPLRLPTVCDTASPAEAETVYAA